MNRAAVLFAALFAAGCGSRESAPAEPDDGVGDFSGWATATNDPIRIAPAAWFYCREPTPEERRALDAGKEKHGPHHRPAVVVRTNAEAFVAFHARLALRVGAIVVKEKHWDAAAKGPPAEFAAMIKREPGYDPAHRDWEYVYVVTQPERKVTRGKLESCIGCHSNAKDTDYLFRSYLPRP